MKNRLPTLDDEFLRFAGLVLIRWSSRGECLALQPHGSNFQGWTAENLAGLRLGKHLLAANRLDAAAFKALLQEDSDNGTPLIWQRPDGSVSSPLPVRWFRNPAGEGAEQIFSLVKDASPAAEPGAADKKCYYQSLFLPGFIHNLNGPLGTLFGRAELLRFQHPDISDLNEIIQAGQQLQEIIKSMNFKINHERYDQPTSQDLNRLLEAELKVLQCDLFFKHHVTLQQDLGGEIPPFPARYLDISGVLTAGYRFLRQFMPPEHNYRCRVGSFRDGNEAGFTLEMRGDFQADEAGAPALPVALEGRAGQIVAQAPPGLDASFLCECMEGLQGNLTIDAQTDRLFLRYRFPIPKELAAIAT